MSNKVTATPADPNSGQASVGRAIRREMQWRIKWRLRLQGAHPDPEFIVNGAVRSIQSGMTVQADITTDRRRVIDFFLSPVVKYLDEGLEVR